MQGAGASDNPSLQNPRGVNPSAASDAHTGPPAPQTSPPSDGQRGPPAPKLETHPDPRPRPQPSAPAREAPIVTSPVKAQADDRVQTLSRADLAFVAAMLLAILLLSTFHLVRRYGWNATEIEVLPAANDYRFTIDINSATWVEWLQLDGIGEVLARRIVEYREQHGPFQSIDELNEVRGIGDVTLEKMRPYLTVDSTGEVTN
jgi:competence protein ComEA